MKLDWRRARKPLRRRRCSLFERKAGPELSGRNFPALSAPFSVARIVHRALPGYERVHHRHAGDQAIAWASGRAGFRTELDRVIGNR